MQRPQPLHVGDLVVPLLRLRKLVALAAARAAPAGHVQLEVTVGATSNSHPSVRDAALLMRPLPTILGHTTVLAR